MTSLVLGVDGGGSKTQLCLVDRAGTLVHEDHVGGTNPTDNPQWQAAFETLFSGIGPYRSRIVQAVVAVGGYSENPELDRQVLGAVNAALSGMPVSVDNDVYVANDAAFLGEPGVLLIAGTGSMAVTRSTDGELSRVGGWSELFGDEGSAYWIGREALSLATRAIDGRGEPTCLAGQIPCAAGSRDGDRAAGIFNWIGALRHPRSEIAALAIIAIAAAEAGDGPALTLVDTAVDHLAAHVQAGRRNGGLGADGPWSMLGGLSRSPFIRTRLEHRLGPMVAPALPPCGGALWRAASLVGWQVDASWLSQLQHNLNAQARWQSASAAPPFNTGS